MNLMWMYLLEKLAVYLFFVCNYTKCKSLYAWPRYVCMATLCTSMRPSVTPVTQTILCFVDRDLIPWLSVNK